MSKNSESSTTGQDNDAKLWSLRSMREFASENVAFCTAMTAMFSAGVTAILVSPISSAKEAEQEPAPAVDHLK